MAAPGAPSSDLQPIPATSAPHKYYLDLYHNIGPNPDNIDLCAICRADVGVQDEILWHFMCGKYGHACCLEEWLKHQDKSCIQVRCCSCNRVYDLTPWAQKRQQFWPEHTELAEQFNDALRQVDLRYDQTRTDLSAFQESEEAETNIFLLSQLPFFELTFSQRPYFGHDSSGDVLESIIKALILYIEDFCVSPSSLMVDIYSIWMKLQIYRFKLAEVADEYEITEMDRVGEIQTAIDTNLRDLAIKHKLTRKWSRDMGRLHRLYKRLVAHDPTIHLDEKTFDEESGSIFDSSVIRWVLLSNIMQHVGSGSTDDTVIRIQSLL